MTVESSMLRRKNPTKTRSTLVIARKQVLSRSTNDMSHVTTMCTDYYPQMLLHTVNGRSYKFSTSKEKKKKRLVCHLPPTQSQKPKMFSLSTPKSCTSWSLVLTATWWRMAQQTHTKSEKKKHTHRVWCFTNDGTARQLWLG